MWTNGTDLNIVEYSIVLVLVYAISVLSGAMLLSVTCALDLYVST